MNEELLLRRIRRLEAATPNSPLTYFLANGASGSLAHATANLTIINATETLDSRGAYSTVTGIFTAPFAGVYAFSGSLLLESATYMNMELRLIVDGTMVHGGIIQNTSGFNQVRFSDYLVNLSLNSTVKLYGWHENAATAARAIWADARFNYFSGRRIA